MQVSPVLLLTPVPVSDPACPRRRSPASALWILVRLSPVLVSRPYLSPTTIPALPLWILVRLSPVPVSRPCLSPTTIPASPLWILVRLSPVPVSRPCLSPTTIPASPLWILVCLSPVPVSRPCLSPTTILIKFVTNDTHLSLCCYWVQTTHVTVQSGQRMDPAPNPDPLAHLDRVETQLQHQEAMFASTMANIQLAAANQEQALATLSTQVQQLTATLAQSLSMPAPPSHPPSRSPPPAPAYSGPVLEARVGVPERYAGDPEGCNPFITNCLILFALQPYIFATEEDKVAFTINSLMGRTRLWGTAEWNATRRPAPPSTPSPPNSARW